MKEEFEKITKVRLPFDRRHEDPCKNYGVAGLSVWFILRGPKGATQFMVSFPTYLPSVLKWWASRGIRRNDEISGFDVGYHALTPQFEGQAINTDCDILPGGKCYSDGSALRADDWAREIFSIQGKHLEDEVWSRLEADYRERFET